MPRPGTSGIHNLTAAAVKHWISQQDAGDQAPVGPVLGRAGRPPLAVGNLAGATKQRWTSHRGRRARQSLDATSWQGPSVTTGCHSSHAAAGNQWNSQLGRRGCEPLDLTSRCRWSGTTGAQFLAVPAGRHVNHWISQQDAGGQAPLGPSSWPCRPATTGCWQLGRRDQEPLDCSSWLPHPAITGCHVLAGGLR